METFKILALLLFALLPLNHFSQMVNGGFESYDGVSPDNYPFSIEYATGWHNLNNTCDLVHPSALGAAGTPRTGVGCARFGLNSYSHSDEYFYGTTNNLTAGTIYVISFWVRKDYTSSPDYQVGAYISSNTPTPMVTNPTYIASVSPQVIEPVTSIVYKKVSFCYTASQSGIHYLTFGSFKQNSIPTDNYLLFYIDDVSVEVQGISPVASIVPIPNLFCSNASIILDGTSSSNETEYEWNIYENTSGSEVLVYDGARISGNAGVVNASVLLGSNLQAGSCYRAYLTVYNGCGVTTFVDFCIENPNIDFISDGNPVCEGQLINLSVTGDNGWTYTWYQGGVELNSGIGLKNLNVTPEIGNSTFTVIVTTPLGCTHSENINFIVHSNNNLAPWMNGINGSGEYTIYANQGDIVDFSSSFFNDNSNEFILYSISNNNTPSGTITPLTNGTLETLEFYWNTGWPPFAPNVAPGIYHFTVTANDKNSCVEGVGIFTFNIVVVCDHCPICVHYDNRTPSTIPLPSETKAGKCIEAGWSASVSGGSEHIVFQAGEYISMGDFFDSGTDYEAIIDPTTCVTDCEDCCDDWNGFTLDEIANGYQINMLEDDDPTNDFFQVTDVNHPFCAFGAIGYELVIIRGANEIHYSSFSGSSCCPFESPAPENPIEHSSIWWDGYETNFFGNYVEAPNGIYNYELTLFGCNSEQEVYHGFIDKVRISYGLIVAPTTYEGMTEDQITDLTTSIEEQNRLVTEIKLSPNPANDVVEIMGIELGKIMKAQLYDEKGVLIERELKMKNNQFNVSSLSSGTYFCKLFIEGHVITKKFVKL